MCDDELMEIKIKTATEWSIDKDNSVWLDIPKKLTMDLGIIMESLTFPYPNPDTSVINLAWKVRDQIADLNYEISNFIEDDFSRRITLKDSKNYGSFRKGESIKHKKDAENINIQISRIRERIMLLKLSH